LAAQFQRLKVTQPVREGATPGNARSIEHGLRLLEHATDAKLCASLVPPLAERYQRRMPLRPPAGSEVVFADAGEAACSLDVAEFDLDNDGTSDRVYRGLCQASSHDGTEYYAVAPSWSPGALACGATTGRCPDADSAFVKALRKASQLALPLAWRNTAHSDPEYRLRHRAEPAASAAHPEPGKRHTTVTLRYLHLTPFRVRGVSYLLSAPPEHALATEDTFFVLRPRGARPPEEVCVFQQVQPNF